MFTNVAIHIKVVVMVTHRDALMVVTDIKECLNELEEEMVPVPVELVDSSVAMIYAKSKRGKVSVCV